MKIACLGWGSLVWDPRTLPIRREWFQDGPFAPIEFTRQSSDGRVTLVIDPLVSPVRVLWAQMVPTDLATAREALRDREGISGNDWATRVGTWQSGDAAPVVLPDLLVWAERFRVDAAIWAALGHKFNGKHIRPSVEQVVQYLGGLTGTQRDDAKQYVERTPRQIEH